MKLLAVITSVALFLGTAVGQGNTPSNGFVPDEATAVKIAEAVLIPVYGANKIESERPFTAKLKKGVWTVAGTLRCSDGKGGSLQIAWVGWQPYRYRSKTPEFFQ